TVLWANDMYGAAAVTWSLLEIIAMEAESVEYFLNEINPLPKKIFYVVPVVCIKFLDNGEK
ncbi:hypothetical protein ACJX0J_020448, partial [Zea mays]